MIVDVTLQLTTHKFLNLTQIMGVADKVLPRDVAVSSTPHSVLQQITSLTWLMRKVTVPSLGVIFPVGTLNWHDQNSVCWAPVGPQDIKHKHVM